MRLRVQTDHFTTLLLAALGLAPIGACGGAVTSNVGGDSGAGGQAGNGSAVDGVSSTGGSFVGVGGGFVGQGGFTTGQGGNATSGVGGFVEAGSFEGGSDGGFGFPFPCVTDIYEEADAGPNGGYRRCVNGLIHRPGTADCPSFVPRDIVFAIDMDASDRPFNPCQRDTDCTAAPHGYCNPLDVFGGPFAPGPTCSYGCVRDQECGMNQVCVCGNPVGHCENASCVVDGQCGPGFVCGSYVALPGCPGESFACQSLADECSVDSDCKTLGNRCTYQQNHRVCSAPTCAVGRPFLVDGSARMAARGGGNAWQVIGARPKTAHLSIECRTRLAEEWTKVGLMEHASIAAFARFTLQLMSLGAPADLIERSNAATCDETLHAKLAFSIASGYAGRDVGPGRLDVRRALESGSMGEILINVIREGCIGETVAAVEAAESLEHAVDPVVRNALTCIARDELKHADLAWQFVRWAIENGGDELRELAALEFETVRASILVHANASIVSAHEENLLAGGILSAAMKREVRATTIERVVLVCARALLESPSAFLAAS